jgi:transaldolase/glucose-6-phosphate isomerase
MQTEYHLGEFQTEFEKVLDDWTRKKFLPRMWHKDPTLWSPQPIPELRDRLGWMDLPHTMITHLEDLKAFARQVRSDGFSRVLLLGMGGASLAPEVFHRVLGCGSEFPELIVLDSTHPAEIRRLEGLLDPQRVLCVISSKSGTTLETISLFHYFWEWARGCRKEPGSAFVAVTDPGSPLAELAEAKDFRRTFLAPPDVGGRFSALSYFGLVPAALIGVNLTQLMASASRAALKNGAVCNKASAPGLRLGAALGAVARQRNKLTFLTSPGLQDLPPWLEQLIAESTGKNGKGLLPVVAEPLPASGRYSDDRCFIRLQLRGEDEEHWLDMRQGLIQAGHPVITRVLNHPYDLSAEMYDWEFAVAAASAILGVHPFNQPDVQLTKKLTREAMQSYDQGEDVGAAKSVDIAELKKTQLQAWLRRASLGTYIALQAFLPPSPGIWDSLQGLREIFLNQTGRATTLGFGPRFLHSTGQLHKGGPRCGVFLQLIDKMSFDLTVPGKDYSFGNLIGSQAWADCQALIRGEAPVLRIDLGTDALSGLESLKQIAAVND